MLTMHSHWWEKHEQGLPKLLKWGNWTKAALLYKQTKELLPSNINKLKNFCKYGAATHYIHEWFYETK